jgi:hypothetical protein
VPGLVKTLKEQRDAADVDVVKKLANKKTRESMEALVDVYARARERLHAPRRVSGPRALRRRARRGSSRRSSSS